MKRPQPAQRKPRADAERNRDRVLEVAKEAFTRSGADATLDDIAKQAGVGPGTLYRHFPSREALIEAVYRTEVEKLAAAGCGRIVLTSRSQPDSLAQAAIERIRAMGADVVVECGDVTDRDTTDRLVATATATGLPVRGVLHAAAVVEAKAGEGKVFAMGPEVTFRGEPDGTFKLLFNGLFYGAAKPTTLR